MAGIRVGFGQPQAPRNVQQITKAAQEYEYDAGVPMRYWLRTAAALVKEVSDCGKLSSGFALINTVG
jgi:hypothetical protein